MKWVELATKMQRDSLLGPDYLVSIIFEMTARSEKKKAKSLEGCIIYTPNKIRKSITGFWLRHSVDIHDLCKKVAINQYEDAWATEPLRSMREWLTKNATGNYRFIIVPADETSPEYHHLKRNRVEFSRADDAMAFKLRWL